MKLNLYVTNLGKYVEGNLVGEWLELPCDENEINRVLKNININESYEEYFITDYEINEELEGILEVNEYSDIFEINKKLNYINKKDINTNLLGAYMRNFNVEFYKSIDCYEDKVYFTLENSNLDLNENIAYSYIKSLYGDIESMPKELLIMYFDRDKYIEDNYMEFEEFEYLTEDEIYKSMNEYIDNIGIENILHLEYYFNFYEFGESLSTSIEIDYISKIAMFY